MEQNEIHLLLFGSLLKNQNKITNNGSALPLDEPASLDSLIDRFEIPSEKVQIAMVNHKAVHMDHLVHPGDRVSLFPPEYAFFADWKGFRK